jgi:hypothetical protein
MTMTFFYDSKGEEVKTYDLDQMFQADGMNMPGEEARETFAALRTAMKGDIKFLAQVLYKEDVTIVYRELEHIRLDALGFSDNRLYKAWLTKPSRKHPFGQVRSDSFPMIEGVRLQGNGIFVSTQEG